MTKKRFIGIDIGTTIVKVAAFCADGVMSSVARSPLTIIRSSSGWSELDMDTVWLSVRSCLLEVASAIPPEDIAGIGVCGQGDGLWMIDHEGQPVRNAILWNDNRAAPYVERWTANNQADTIARNCRTSVWPGASGAILAWLRDHEPAALDKAAHIFSAKDWITFKLTGHIGTDFCDSCIPFLDLTEKAYSAEVISALDLDDIASKLAAPYPATKAVGSLRPDLGLPRAPVAAGTLDLASMMVGLGLNDLNDMCFILGTTAVVAQVIAPEPYDQHPVGATLLHPFNEAWLRVLAPQSGASAFDWFATLYPNTFEGDSPAEIARRINADAQAAPPGANGVLFMPFLTGERAPFVAPNATSSFVGMTSATTRADLARAVMEGTCFSLRHCMIAMSANTSDHVVLTGGGARNELWCQILADMLGVTILANLAEDHGLWGAAMLGGAAAGEIAPTFKRNETFQSYAPDPDVHANYLTLFDTYQKALSASADMWKALN